MVTENVTTGAGTCVYEGTRERKKSEVAEQGLLQSQGREEVQGQRSPQCWGSLQPRQDGARPTLRGRGAKEPAASTLSSRVRASEAGAGILPASPWLVSHSS